MIRIRSSNPSDVDRITEIEKLCFEKHLRYGPSILFNLLNSARYTALTANVTQEKNSSAVGVAVGEKDQNKENLGRIVLILIDPRFQRKKIGTSLLKALEENLIMLYNVNSFELQVHFKNDKAIHFYQKNGYKIMNELRNYYERKEHAYLMKK